MEHLIRWGEQNPLVRAMLLTSTHAIPEAEPDILSDYDVILVLVDIVPFFEDRTWLEEFGPVLALYRDPLIPEDGFLKSAYVTQYENDLKIDFSLWPVGLMRKISSRDTLTDELDAGYKILLDKDHLTDDLKPPTYRGYIPEKPTQTEYLECIEMFFLEAAYVAKYLWRDDLVAAIYVLDTYMKQEHLRPMLEWHLEFDHSWDVKPGPYGRGLKKWLRKDLYADLLATYTGAQPEAIWEAMFDTITLMRTTATEVGDQLGFQYPDSMDQRVRNHLQKIQKLP